MIKRPRASRTIYVLFLAVVAASILLAVFLSLFFQRHMNSEEWPPHGDQEIIEELMPYLSNWSSDSPDQSREERLEIGRLVDVEILILDWNTTNSGISVPVVDIIIDQSNGKLRGYLYVDLDIELLPLDAGWELWKINDNIYAYTYTS